MAYYTDAVAETVAAMQDALEAAHASSADVNEVYANQQLIALQQQTYSIVKRGQNSAHSHVQRDENTAEEAAGEDFGRLQHEKAAGETVFGIVANVDGAGCGDDDSVIVDAPLVLGELEAEVMYKDAALVSSVLDELLDDIAVDVVEVCNVC